MQQQYQSQDDRKPADKWWTGSWDNKRVVSSKVSEQESEKGVHQGSLTKTFDCLADVLVLIYGAG